MSGLRSAQSMKTHDELDTILQNTSGLSPLPPRAPRLDISCNTLRSPEDVGGGRQRFNRSNFGPEGEPRVTKG